MKCATRQTAFCLVGRQSELCKNRCVTGPGALDPHCLLRHYVLFLVIVNNNTWVRSFLLLYTAGAKLRYQLLHLSDRGPNSFQAPHQDIIFPPLG
jgi:hypothetical protein